MSEQTPHQNVEFSSNGGTAHGYLATPESGSGPGLIVIQEWWGLTDHIADVTNRFAAQGYTALAPDLYGGSITHDSEEAGQMMQNLPEDKAAMDLGGAVDFLLDHGAVTSSKIGVVGFCMGGGFVIQLAAQQGDKIGAAIPYYGVLQSQPDFSAITAAVLGHYAETDDFAPADKALEMGAAIREAGGQAAINIYGGTGHAFFNDENRMGTYDSDAAAVSWSRTLAFLAENLG
ncbi:dienelactone hydrolase family protein [Euzebya tangerina]|uniref:dienelactone hydrolase family protein n=1 Tax=Euzebya tangerina TaxID=591198 RepID=UPI000E32106B|nr:dienelactone hydrolase family protein [Euzebya tangerina]